MGKGSKSRIIDKKRYDKEYERIYGKKGKNENIIPSKPIQPTKTKREAKIYLPSSLGDASTIL